MSPGSTEPWPHAEPLAPLRAWVRERHARDDVSWVGACFLLEEDEGRYRRLEGQGGTRTTGLGMRRLTSKMMVDAAGQAHADDRPTMLEAAEMLFLPMELLTATRDAWWKLGSHPVAARMLLEAFGLGEAKVLGDHERAERLLAWLPRYLPGRGCGPEARALLDLLDTPGRGAFVRLPGEDDGGDLAVRGFDEGAQEAAADEQRDLLGEATAELSLETWAESIRLDPDQNEGALDLIQWLQRLDDTGRTPDEDAGEAESETGSAEALVDLDDLDDLEEVDDLDDDDEAETSDQPLPAGPAALSAGEVAVLRPLEWYAGRVDPIGVHLRIESGLVLSSGGRPALRAQDGVVRLQSDAAPLTLRVVPPWTCLRYLPPEEAETP